MPSARQARLNAERCVQGLSEAAGALGLFDIHRLKRYRNGADLANTIRDAREAYQQTAAALFLDQRGRPLESS